MKIILVILGLIFSSYARAADDNLIGSQDSSDTVTEVYRDMIVVQRKAKAKASRFLLQIFDTSEFSDGPEQVNSLGLAFGYALSDHFEVSLDVVPVFFLQDQPIKSQVQNLNLATGQKAYLASPTPQIGYGIELFWLPAYGKDSWGPHSIVRSDTFFKLSIRQVQYSSGTGMTESLGIGKTFFLSRLFNPRVSAMYGVHDSIVNGTKTQSQVGLLELGAIWYL